MCDTADETIKLHILKQAEAHPILDKASLNRSQEILTLCNTGCITDVQHDDKDQNARY
jgi:hypothetical protein